MSDPTRNDQMAKTLLPCPDGTYVQQVQIKGGGATATPNMMCLEDDNGLFYGIYYIESDGTISNLVYVDVNGDPYTPVGTIKKPHEINADVEQKLFCDALGNKYYKHTVYDDAGQVQTIFDTDLTGAVYIPTAPEKLCTNDVEFELISKETLSVGGGLVAALTPPADADSAFIQVKTPSCVYFYVDGSAPAVGSGYELGDYATLEIGCKGEGDPVELSNFQIISAAGETSTVEVTYYKKK